MEQKLMWGGAVWNESYRGPLAAGAGGQRGNLLSSCRALWVEVPEGSPLQASPLPSDEVSFIHVHTEPNDGAMMVRGSYLPLKMPAVTQCRAAWKVPPPKTQVGLLRL